MRRAAAYIRVSRAREDGVSPENQLEKARQWCSLHGAQLLYVEEDIDASGRTDRRPGFQRVMQLVKSGAVDLVVVYKIDRFGRNVKEFHQHVATLETHGVDLVSVSQNFDTSTPIGRLIRNILADFAQFESEMIGERVSDSKRQHAARGGWNGGQVPYGYRWIEDDKQLVVDERRARWVRQMFSWYIEGHGSTSIARMLDEATPPPRGRRWDSSTIRWILQNEVYVGRISYAGESVPGSHEPIIDEPTFAQAQHRLGNAPTQARASGHLLSGLVRCGMCGSLAYITYNGPRAYRRYVCGRRSSRGKEACLSPYLDADTLEAAITRHILSLAEGEQVDQWLAEHTKEPPGEETDDAEAERRDLETRLERIELTMKELFADYYDAKVITREQFVEANEAYLRESEGIKQRLDELAAHHTMHTDRLANVLAWREAVVTLMEAWAELTLAEKQMALSAVVKVVHIRPQNVSLDLFLKTVELPATVRRGTLYFGDKV